MDVLQLERIRRLTVISLFSDDTLMDIFVLKGGSALNLIYDINSRASIDIDVSMEEDFDEENMEYIKNKLETSLRKPLLKKGFAYLTYLYPPNRYSFLLKRKIFGADTSWNSKSLNLKNMIT